MKGLFWALRVMGWRELLRLRRARVWGWEGVIQGHCLTRAIQTAITVGLIEAIRRQGCVDPAEFAAENGLDPDVIACLCHYLRARRVLIHRDHGFGLDARGHLLAESDLLAGWFTLVDGYEPVLHALGALAAGRVRYGQGVTRDPERVAVGSGLASASFYFPLVIDLVREKGWRTVLDIGCGDGMFLRRLCRELSHVRGIGIDLATEAIARGRQTLAEEGWDGRITLQQGDALELQRLGDATKTVDAATAFFVLHELAQRDGDGHLPAFLERFRASCPTATMVVVETLRPDVLEMRRRPGPAIEYFLLHDLSGQAPLNRQAWRRLLEAAGFLSVEERHLAFARSAIYLAQ